VKVLGKQKDAALVTAHGVYLCERAHHKRVHGAITSASEVQPQARLVQGAAMAAADLARRAVDEVPISKRPKFEAQLARANQALSSSLYGMSQSVSHAGSELVAASVQVRECHKAAHDYMPGI
jgi:hypothetical protein